MNTDAKQKKIIVTGASGFLGTNLIRCLQNDARYQVYALSSRAREFQEANTRQNILYCGKDAVFSEKADSIFHGAILIHCAFPRVSSGAEIADGLRYIQKLFDTARDCGANTIVNISSQSVYSAKRETAASEATPPCPETIYAVGKYATELMLESACRGSAIRRTSLRLASLIGPGFNQRIINRLVMQALAGWELKINAGKQVYGYLDISDAVSGLCALISSESLNWKPIYNLGATGGYSLEEIARSVCGALARQQQIQVPCAFEFSDDYTNTTMDCTAFSADFHWKPALTLDESVKKIVSYEITKEHAD